MLPTNIECLFLKTIKLKPFKLYKKKIGIAILSKKVDYAALIFNIHRVSVDVNLYVSCCLL